MMKTMAKCGEKLPLKAFCVYSAEEAGLKSPDRVAAGLTTDTCPENQISIYFLANMSENRGALCSNNDLYTPLHLIWAHNEDALSAGIV